MSEFSEKNKALIIYRASAGSGKTFTLVTTYLELVLKDESNFGSILAATFTKSAAKEMRERIISALYKLSTLSDLKYADQISQKLALTKETIQQKSTKILHLILHNYELFQISTIDRFNLGLIKTFSKDLELEQDFQPLTDVDELFDLAVNNLLEKQNTSGNEQLSATMIAYSSEMISEGNGYSIRKKVKELTSFIHGKNDQKNVDELLTRKPRDIQFFRDYKIEKNKIETQNKTLWKEVIEVFENLQDSKNFITGWSNLFNAILKIGNGKIDGATVAAVQNNNLKYAKTMTLKTGVTAEKIESLLTVVNEFLWRYEELEMLINSFFKVELFKYLLQEYDQILKKQKLVPVSYFDNLISELIRDEAAPYIYERMGNRFNHYLLDEFQDNSISQWRNLIPLLHESISKVNDQEKPQKSLIVGDAKQSIYRFRGGVPEQFNVLPAIYNPENIQKFDEISPQFEALGKKESLPNNFRSSKGVVLFNNCLFQAIAPKLPENSISFYDDIVQLPVSQKIGYIFYENNYKPKLKTEKKKDANADSVQVKDIKSEESDEENAIIPHFWNRLSVILEQIQKDKYDLADICILAFKGEKIREYAKCLNENGFKVVSVDGLQVSQSSTVQFLISFFRFRASSTSRNNALSLAENYFNVFNSEITTLFETDLFNELMIQNEDLLIKFLEDDRFQLNYSNLYELGIKAIELFKLADKTDFYVQHFLDMLFDFDLKWQNNLASFLSFFETKGHKSSVSIPEQKDAIKMMTAHKSKGLEFPIVIILDEEWVNLGRTGNEQFLLKTDSDEFVFTTLNAKKTSGFIQNKLLEIQNNTLVDKVNLMYVACTRAVDRLYILDKKAPSESGINMKETILNAMTEVSDLSRNIILNSSEHVFELGLQEAKVHDEKSEHSDNMIVVSHKSETLWFPDIRFEDTERINARNESMKYGILLHETIANIDFLSLDLNQEIERIVETLDLPHLMITEIEKDLKLLVNDAILREKLMNAKHVFKEESILMPDGTELRPDLIIQEANNAYCVVDFKTGEQESKHQLQVIGYVNVLKLMFDESVSGMLYYTKSKELVSVL